MMDMKHEDHLGVLQNPYVKLDVRKSDMTLHRGTRAGCKPFWCTHQQQRKKLLYRLNGTAQNEQPSLTNKRTSDLICQPRCWVS